MLNIPFVGTRSNIIIILLTSLHDLHHIFIMLKPNWIQKTISKGFGGKHKHNDAVSLDSDHNDV